MDNSNTFRSCLFVLYQTRFEFEVDNFYTIMQTVTLNWLK